MEEEKKLTYEQLEFRLALRDEEINRLSKVIREKEESLRREKLILLGMVSEHFHLRVTISPEIITSAAFELTQTLLANYCKRTAYEIEERLGQPLRRLQEALMHIHYLENHAMSRGLSFTPFEQRASDAWLYH